MINQIVHFHGPAPIDVLNSFTLGHMEGFDQGVPTNNLRTNVFAAHSLESHLSRQTIQGTLNQDRS